MNGSICTRPTPVPPHRAADIRRRGLLLTVLATLLVGAVMSWWPDEFRLPGSKLFRPTAISDPRGHAAGKRDEEIRSRFAQGVMMLHMRQYDHALTAFHRVIELAPRMPEAHVNMGFALLGLQRWAAARDFFESATALRGEQANAYYGLAIALEELGDRAGAIGAMRTYLHRAPADDAFRRKAEAALWEWQTAGARR